MAFALLTPSAALLLSLSSPGPLDNAARILGLHAEDLQPHGHDLAKVSPGVLARPNSRRARYVMVCGVTPTPEGEGKSVHTIGLAMALQRCGRRAVCVIPQPSIATGLGPGRRPPGGGACRLEPDAAVGLHLTGDLHAVAAAHNTVAAIVDAAFSDRVVHSAWPRVCEPFDPVLGARGDIAVTQSEIMAVLSLTRDADALRRRLAAIVVGTDRSGGAVTIADLSATGAVFAAVERALAPTLMRTCENTPALVHTGLAPDVGHGSASVIAEAIALHAVDFVVTEAAHGAELGAEKLFNIKARISGARPDAVVLVATLRALQRQGHSTSSNDTLALRAGLGNLEQHIEILRLHGMTPIVAVNRMAGDRDDDVLLVCETARRAGAFDAFESRMFERGSVGAEALAESVMHAADEPSSFRHLYPSAMSLRDKIETVAVRVYGAGGIEISAGAARQLEALEEQGHGRLPVCISKTELSLSHDPALLGRPSGFRLPVESVRVFAGAGYVVVETGSRAAPRALRWLSSWRRARPAT